MHYPAGTGTTTSLVGGGSKMTSECPRISVSWGDNAFKWYSLASEMARRAHENILENLLIP